MSARSRAVHIAAGPLSYRERIEAEYARNPEATLRQVQLATGAPVNVVRTVYGRLIAAGRLVRPIQPCRFDSVWG